MHYTAIVILQYGNSKATVECIESVTRYNTAPVKFIVVDNCSPCGDDVDAIAGYLCSKFGTLLDVDDSYEPVGALPEATLIRSGVNDGYARGNNKGLKLAFADVEVDYVLILNNDILFVEDIIPKLRADIERLPASALVSPLLYKKNLEGVDANCARREMKFSYILKYNLLIMRTTSAMNRSVEHPIAAGRGIVPVSLVSGSCIMVRKDVFRQIGGFDPNTFLYFEENILWEKVKQLGRQNYVDTDIKCIHLGAATIGKRLSRPVLKLTCHSQRYFVKNYMAHGKVKNAILWLAHQWMLGVLYVRHLF